jgi:hypothetical protein
VTDSSNLKLWVTLQLRHKVTQTLSGDTTGGEVLENSNRKHKEIIEASFKLESGITTFINKHKHSPSSLHISQQHAITAMEFSRAK